MTFDFGGALGGFNDWRRNNRNMLLGTGAGFLSGDLGNVPLYAMEGQKADTAYATQQKAEAERQAQINQTAQWARGQFPELANAPDELVAQMAPALWQKQFMGGDTDPTSTYEGRLKIGQEQGLAGTDLTTYALTGNLPTGRGAAGELSLTPTWLRDANGNLVPGQIDKSGAMNVTNIPEGYSVVDPFAVAGGKTTATVDAKTAAEARAALPGAQQAVMIAQKATDSLLNDTQGMAEQFGSTLGIPNQYIPDWAMAKGSPMARFRTELAQGQGQSFMQARQMLKGGGPITDFEGAKAEAAFSRMQLAAQNNNQEEFMQAVRDFQDAVNTGYQKLVQAAQGDYAAGAPAVTGGGGNKTATGVSWSVTP